MACHRGLGLDYLFGSDVIVRCRLTIPQGSTFSGSVRVGVRVRVRVRARVTDICGSGGTM